MTRSELLTSIFGKEYPKGTREYGTLANLVTKNKIPFTLIDGAKLFENDRFEEIKRIVLAKFNEIENPKFISSLALSKRVQLPSTTMQAWLDEGLIPHFVKKKGVFASKLDEVIEAIEKLKKDKENILGRHSNEAHLFPCKICGELYPVKPSHYETGQSVTCSSKCSEIYRTTQKLFPGAKPNEEIMLDDYLREVIYGELLGDGCLAYASHTDGINARFQYTTSKKEYAEYLRQLLISLNPSEVKYSLVGTGFDTLDMQPRFDRYSFKTETNVSLTKIYRYFYPNGVKIVPKDIELTPVVCLHWYIGDGCLVTNKKTNQQFIELETQGFSEEDINILIEKMYQNGFEFLKRKDGISKKLNQKYKLVLKSKFTTKFLKYIGECQVECYKYKWNIIDSNYELYEDYIYSTGDIGKILNIDKRKLLSCSKTKWFKEANIDCTKVWSRLRFSQEGLAQFKECLVDRNLL